MAKKRRTQCSLCGAMVQNSRLYTRGSLAGHNVCHKCGKLIDADNSYFDYLHEHCKENGGVLCSETVIPPADYKAQTTQG